GWSWIAPVTGWADAPTLQDIRDYIQAPAGYEGTVTLELSRIYSDGTVVTWDASITVDAPAVAPTVTINDYTGTDTTPSLSGTIDDPTAEISVNIDGSDYQG